MTNRARSAPGGSRTRVHHCLNALILAAALAVAATPAATAAQCIYPLNLEPLIAPFGDLNGSGEVTVVDVQCGIITVLWEIGGGEGSPPDCVGGPTWQTDVLCDGTSEVSDIVQLIQLAVGLPLGPSIDSDSDGCPDTCSPPTLGAGLAGYAHTASEDGTYRLRQAPVLPAAVGTSQGGGYQVRARPFDRITPNEEGGTP